MSQQTTSAWLAAFPRQRSLFKSPAGIIRTGFFAVILLALALSVTGCRIEIGLTPPPQVTPTPPKQAAALVMPPTATPAPIIIPTETTSAPATATALPTPAPTMAVSTASATEAIPTLEPTPTPIPLIPAQLPPDHLAVAAIGLDVPVKLTGWTEKQGQEPIWLVPEDAPGWHENSALPGHGSNVVLSGHHNMGTEVFKDLVNLKVGDKVILGADGRDYYYAVTDRFIVAERDVSDEQRLQNAQWISPTTDERLTLVTCWPYNDNSHRVIVIAKPVEPFDLTVSTAAK